MKPTSTIEKREFEDTISGCYKALESTLKVICQRKEWSFSKRETAGKLIQTVFKKGLIPSELQSHFHSLKNTLLEGVPSKRNQFSGHGTVSTPRQVPAYLAAYALNMTASAIVLLAEALGKGSASPFQSVRNGELSQLFQ